MLRTRWFVMVAAMLLVANAGCGKGQKAGGTGGGGQMSSSSGDKSGAGGKSGGGDHGAGGAAGGAAASKSMSAGAGGAGGTSSGGAEGAKAAKGERNAGILHTKEGWVLTEDDNGKYLILHPGEMVLVRVGASKTNGYKWEVAGNEGGVLSQVGAETYTAGTKTSKTDGTETWRYRGAKMGETTVQMKYLPPYSKTVPERVLNFTVAVK